MPRRRLRRQILCCGSSAALGMIERKGSTRETRHIELKAFFLQQWSARPEVRRAKCLLIVSQRYSRHRIRFISRDSDCTPNPVMNRFELGQKDRAEEGCRKSTLLFFDTSVCFLCFGESRGNSSHVWRSSELHTRNNTSTSLSLRSLLTTRAEFLSLQNTFSVHVTVETTQNILEIPAVQELVI